MKRHGRYQLSSNSVITGVKMLDEVTGGFRGGEVTILSSKAIDGKNWMSCFTLQKMLAGLVIYRWYFPWRCLKS